MLGNRVTQLDRATYNFIEGMDCLCLYSKVNYLTLTILIIANAYSQLSSKLLSYFIGFQFTIFFKNLWYILLSFRRGLSAYGKNKNLL